MDSTAKKQKDDNFYCNDLEQLLKLSKDNNSDSVSVVTLKIDPNTLCIKEELADTEDNTEYFTTETSELLPIKTEDIEIKAEEGDLQNGSDCQMENASHSTISKKKNSTTHQCTICSYTTESKQSFKEHTDIHRDPSDPGFYKCQVCDYRTKQKAALKVHMLTHMDPSEVTWYKCHLCPYASKIKGGLRVHMLTHRSFKEGVQNSVSSRLRSASLTAQSKNSNSDGRHDDSSKEKTLETNNTEVTQADKTKKIKKKKRQRNFCCFCETEVLNFSRHIARNHSGELEVRKIAKTRDRRQRKVLINAIRKKGNFLKNIADECIKPMRKSIFPNRSYLPCPYCLGFYSSKHIYRHRNTCPKNSKAEYITQSSAQNRLIAHLKVDKHLKELVFTHMRADKVSLEAKKDALICAFGAKYLKAHHEKYFVNITSRKMRELSKILMEMRNIQPAINNMFEALQPEYYDALVAATKIVAKFDAEKNTYGVPTLAANISTSLKQCCAIAKKFALKNEGHYSNVDPVKAEADLKTMIHLLTTNWKFDINISQTALNVNALNNITIVPLTRDLKLLEEFLRAKTEDALSKISKNNKDATAYVTLTEAVFCMVVLLSGRRPGELQRLTLQTYEKCTKQNYEEFERFVSPMNKILLKKCKRFMIRGEYGRGVQVLFSADMHEQVEKLIQLRPSFVKTENPYLFGKPDVVTPIYGFKVLQRYAKACGAENYKFITCTRLRKLLSILSKIFLMNENEVEGLANFFGCTLGIRVFPDDVYEAAKLAKLSLSKGNEDAVEYSGTPLDEIEVDLESNLLGDCDNIEESEDDDDIYKGNVSPGSEKITDSQVKKRPPVQVQKGKRILIPWTTEQKRVVKQFFKDHIKKKRAAKRGECEELINMHPDLLSNKSWEKIKVFVQNIYKNKPM